MADFPIEELSFAARYPFSNTAKRIVKTLNPDVNSVVANSKLMDNARNKLLAILKREPYPTFLTPYQDDLLVEVLAYPLVRIMLSFLDNIKYYEYFSDAIYRTSLNHMSSFEDWDKLAADLGISFRIDSNDMFAVPILDFLKCEAKENTLKLVNQSVSKGQVFLNENRFRKFVAGFAAQVAKENMPVNTEGLPKKLKELAFETLTQATSFAKKTLRIKANLAYLPPCIEKIYSDLLAGKNIPHMARFVLATFLNAINVPEEKIIEAFTHAPNYNEKITRYQVARIVHAKSGKNYAPASCKKMKSYGLCIANCNVRNPIQYYRRQLTKSQSRVKKRE